MLIRIEATVDVNDEEEAKYRISHTLHVANQQLAYALCKYGSLDSLHVMSYEAWAKGEIASYDAAIEMAIEKERQRIIELVEHTVKERTSEA